MTEKKALDKVYGATNEAELAEGYAEWAASYDRETAELGYALPFMITSWVTRYVAREDGPLLDAGCGTGLTGPYLKALGYGHVDGLDLSEEMLEIARSRDAYSALKQARLGETLPWDGNYFAAVLAAGVFTLGHAPATSFDELIRITRPGGHVAFTIRDRLLDDGFRGRFDALEGAGQWRLAEESSLYRPFAIAEPDVFVKTFVYEVA